MTKQSSQLPGVDPRSFRCCLCCHVKTGTLFYGILIGLVHLVFLGFLIFATIRPDILVPNSYQQPYDGIIVVQAENGNFIPNFSDEQFKQPISKDNLCVMFGITLVCLISTVALVYGVARNLASYLMPFFCLQVFDFCLSCLTVVGCFTYAPNVKKWMEDQGLQNVPLMNRLMCLDSDYLMLLFVTCLILVLSIKAYLIGMVWSCYKFIQLHVASRSVVREYAVDPDTEMLLPPCYEEAIKVPSNYPQPPAYSSQ
ncbi:lysosomal-associated transmembrane protein 4A-like [Biomphalaria glabrata]|uniref:Lysosomal-associated transmembrane protein 4A-like n=1 Tax=Biomphalaria glabrata TaxID=6526 RepID=A0A9W3ACY2_BIOGL|nr:lysosomal-associated transmembrane protein 4A-like [Biomphalaria glabrata]KAI8750033.1 lysosomal-associated transmembrane protein 4B [Biomphalaria glabrata]